MLSRVFSMHREYTWSRELCPNPTQDDFSRLLVPLFLQDRENFDRHTSRHLYGYDFQRTSPGACLWEWWCTRIQSLVEKPQILDLRSVLTSPIKLPMLEGQHVCNQKLNFTGLQRSVYDTHKLWFSPYWNIRKDFWSEEFDKIFLGANKLPILFSLFTLHMVEHHKGCFGWQL